MIPQSKQIADFLTWTRAFMLLLLLGMGLVLGSESLPIVIFIVIYNWTADSIDGPLARKSLSLHESWIGQRDLYVDMLFTTGLLLYLTIVRFVSLPVTVIYLFSWIILFWWRGIIHTLGVIYQAPIYLWFIIVSFREAPQFAWWLIIWTVLAIAITWPKLPKIIVPSFFSGLRNLFKNDQRTS